MKKNIRKLLDIDILKASYIYIIILSIFNIFPVLNINSYLTSIIRILAFIALIGYSIANYIIHKKSYNKKVLALILVYFFFQLLIILTCHDITKTSLINAFYPTMCLIVYLILNNETPINRKELVNFCKLFSIYALFSCGYNLVTNINQLSKIFIIKSSYDLQFTSFFHNRNVFGMFLIYGFLASFIGITCDEKENKIKWLISLIIFFINIFFTFSRASILFIVLFLIIYYFSDKGNITKIIKSKKALIVAGIIAILFIIPETRNYILNNVIRIKSGLTHRDSIWTYSIKYYLSHNWFLGNGYIKPYLDLSNSFKHIGFHNTYMTVLICQGLICFTMFILLLIFSLKNSIKLKKYNKTIGGICLSTIICYIIYSFFESRLLFYPEYLDLIVTLFVVLIPLYSLNYYKYSEPDEYKLNDKIKNKDLITVIIPVYNVKNYLRKSLDSVINQTYKNLQIIIVDDGSTDGSSIICDEYAKKDNRIKVIHKENGGLCSARNAGLSEVDGKYIYFIDSDDWISLDTIEVLHDLIVSNKCELSIVNYYIINEKDELAERQYTNKIYTLNQKEAYRKILKNNDIGGYVWNKLYVSDLIKEKFNEKISYREDLLFNCIYLEKINKIAFYDRPYHYYLQRNGSLLNTKKFNERMLSHIDSLERIINICSIKVPEYVGVLQYRLLKSCYNIKYRMNESGIENKEYTEVINTVINKYYIKIKNNKNISYFKRIEIIFLNRNPIFFGKIKNLIKKVIR